ncbi:hypothetical protein [Niveispirillum sp.]|uniref:hypothetical protein n=1 Tax=Niveispirillum sp. TaxID=1917217 RepID=UPI001B777625|nr:hypothetical protein [Niveispirillum sp.]MBP7337850.1 hypothetical protein [Niveispirillum sp.]
MANYAHFNRISGTAAADRLNGGIGFDLFYGGAGNDTFNGGGGQNAAVYSGNSSSYTITNSNTASVRISGPEGTDTLSGVQFAVFADKVVPLYKAAPVFGFDEDVYLQNNADVSAAVQNGTYTSGRQHFELYGKYENRVFEVRNGFDSAYYTNVNGDVAAAQFPANAHYQQYGKAEGRSTHLLFDAGYYLENNSDVAASGADPWTHFTFYGWKENRNPSPFFDVSDYLSHNPDVVAAGYNPLFHYLNWGQAEGRQIYMDTGFQIV